MIGIYKITNLINKKVYIGQSTNIERRWNEHRKRIDDPKMKHYPLYRAFKKYGIDNFSFEVVEKCNTKELNELEKFYIQQYNCVVPLGYNCTLGGETSVPITLTQEKAEEIKQLLMTTSISQAKIGELYGVSQNAISDINTGYCWVSDDIQYPIRKYAQRKKEYYCIDCGKIISQGALRCIDCDKKNRSKQSRKPSREILKDLIRSTPFTTIGANFGVSDNAVRKWCDFYNLPRKVKDIKKYSDEEWSLI